MNEIIKILKSPDNNEDIEIVNDKLISKTSKKSFQIEDNIFKFLNKESIETKTVSVRKFYLDYSFPNYNDFDSLETFIKKNVRQ